MTKIREAFRNAINKTANALALETLHYLREEWQAERVNPTNSTIDVWISLGKPSKQ